MSKKKKYKGIEELKSHYGLLFISPWVVGVLVFFISPIFKSIWFSFCSVTMSEDGVISKFYGLKSYKYYLFEDPKFSMQLTSDITSLLYSLPVILLLSIVLAMLLNQKFKGRIFFRALYFVPVIIASGVVIELLFSTTEEDLVSTGVNAALTDSMFEIEDIAVLLDLPDKIAKYAKIIINNIFDLLWSCGIQTVLFIGGLQSIPASYYEVSKIEGATKWEEFWYITFPMLGNITLLVAVFTMVDQFTSTRREIINLAYTQMSNGIYDTTSAMLWIYFAVAGVVMGVLLILYNRFLMKRWQ